MSHIIPEVQIYSDGGANPNPGPGGYGVILEYKGIKKEFSEGFQKTTNNRMELRGVISGLQKLKNSSGVTITTDSQYVINGIQKGWALNWKKNNWKKSNGKLASNNDLWKILLTEIAKHEVKFNWIKGHNGHPENERCDELATLAQKGNELHIDVGYQEETRTRIDNNQSLQKKSKQDAGLHPLPTSEQTCKSCHQKLTKKIPKHTKKTLQKKYYYAYYLHCENCNKNYMLEEAKRDISTLKL